MLCAIIQNNSVICTSDLGQNQIPILGQIFQQVMDISTLNPTPAAGWTCVDGVNIIPPGLQIIPYAFRQRFLQSELMAIFAASSSNTTIAIFLSNNSLAPFIDLTSNTVQSAMAYLVSLSLVTPERANTILTTPPAPNEVYVPLVAAIQGAING